MQYTINTAKGSFSDNLLTNIVLWQCEHQGAAADINGVDVDGVDFDEEERDVDDIVDEVEALLLADELVGAELTVDCGRIVAVEVTETPSLGSKIRALVAWDGEVKTYETIQRVREILAR